MEVSLHVHDQSNPEVIDFGNSVDTGTPPSA